MYPTRPDDSMSTGPIFYLIEIKKKLKIGSLSENLGKNRIYHATSKVYVVGT